MAKAEITTADGIKLKIEGTPEEVATILAQARKTSLPARRGKATNSKRTSTRKQGLPELLEALREEKYFKVKRALADVRGRLGEVGSHYSATTLGKQLLREVRARRLRRLKENGNWTYVH